MIELHQVSAGYGSTPILRELDLEIEPGSFHFLLGPSGSGKSTFFRLITGEVRPSAGRIRVLGEDVSRLSIDAAARLRRRIGIVSQDNPMLNHLTAWENVAVPLLVLGRKRAEFAPDIADLMEWVGLSEHQHKLPATLSGGEVQRVGIARAIIGRPAILLADEPTSAIDPAMAARLLRLSVELNRTFGAAVIVATHDHHLLDRIDAPRLVIDNGRIAKVDA